MLKIFTHNNKRISYREDFENLKPGDIYYEFNGNTLTLLEKYNQNGVEFWVFERSKDGDKMEKDRSLLECETRDNNRLWKHRDLHVDGKQIVFFRILLSATKEAENLAAAYVPVRKKGFFNTDETMCRIYDYFACDTRFFVHKIEKLIASEISYSEYWVFESDIVTDLRKKIVLKQIHKNNVNKTEFIPLSETGAIQLTHRRYYEKTLLPF